MVHAQVFIHTYAEMYSHLYTRTPTTRGAFPPTLSPRGAAVHPQKDLRSGTDVLGGKGVAPTLLLSDLWGGRD